MAQLGRASSRVMCTTAAAPRSLPAACNNARRCASSDLRYASTVLTHISLGYHNAQDAGGAGRAAWVSSGRCSASGRSWA